MVKRISIALILSFLLCGCVSVLSNRILREADDSTPFINLQNQPERYRGTVVVLGGQIVETLVKEGETWVQVLQLPLGSQHRPDHTASSQGRFIVIYKRFVDPLIYEKGRKITVAGEVEGGKVLMKNNEQYNYPILLERETYLWKMEDYQSYRPGPSFQFGFGVGLGR